MSPHQRSITPHVFGEGCARAQVLGTMILMRNPSPENLPAGPPQDRLWTEDDLSAYMGFRSVSELIARHPNFPSPVPLLMQGRRWRCADVIAWVNHLCDTPSVEPPVENNAAPEFDLTGIDQLLEEARNGAPV